jgi:LysR family transcriptional regulator, glycine cleavage system transcriptional activator
MTYRLPPLAGLRAFEAAARHMSFKRAADELCVTAGAVSQHVRTLEEALGVELFRRLARSIELTAAGRKYLPPVSAAFEMISEATETSAPALRGWKLRVGVAPALQKLDLPAVSSLLSRKAHEQVIGVGVADEPAQVAEGRVHALLRLSDKSCGGLHIERIALRSGEDRVRTVLVTRPGLAGCRQHRTLVKMLHGGR